MEFDIETFAKFFKLRRNHLYVWMFQPESVRILKRPRRGIKMYVFLCDQDTDPRKMTARVNHMFFLATDSVVII